jgi:hypothetical protein
MVYAEVFNMMTYPEDYVGLTMRMRGPYSPVFYDETGRYYHYVLIEDATACCSQGIEFVPGGDLSYPDDFPAEGENVEMNGVYSSYDELGTTYYYLAVESIKTL